MIQEIIIDFVVAFITYLAVTIFHNRLRIENHYQVYLTESNKNFPKHIDKSQHFL